MKKSIIFPFIILLLSITGCHRTEIKTFPFHIDGILYENCSNKPYSNQLINITPSVSGSKDYYEDIVKTIQTDSLGHFSYTGDYTIELNKKDSYRPNMNVYLPKDSISLYFPTNVDVTSFDFKVQDALHLRLYLQGKSTYSNTDTLFYRFKNDYDNIYTALANQPNVLLEDISIPTYKLSYSTFDKLFFSSITYAVGRIKFNSSPNVLYLQYKNCGGMQNDTIKLE